MSINPINGHRAEGAHRPPFERKMISGKRRPNPTRKRLAPASPPGLFVGLWSALSTRGVPHEVGITDGNIAGYGGPHRPHRVIVKLRAGNWATGSLSPLFALKTSARPRRLSHVAHGRRRQLALGGHRGATVHFCLSTPETTERANFTALCRP